MEMKERQWYLALISSRVESQVSSKNNDLQKRPLGKQAMAPGPRRCPVNDAGLGLFTVDQPSPFCSTIETRRASTFFTHSVENLSFEIFHRVIQCIFKIIQVLLTIHFSAFPKLAKSSLQDGDPISAKRLLQ
jgi:hypothetical protein